MRTRRSLRVVLDTEDRAIFEPESRKGSIIEVNVGWLAPHSFERFWIYSKAVILAGDLNSAIELVQNRLIDPTVAELEFEGLGPDGKSEKLVPQANTKGWDRRTLGNWRVP